MPEVGVASKTEGNHVGEVFKRQLKGHVQRINYYVNLEKKLIQTNSY